MNQVSIADADFDMNAHLEMHRRVLEQQRVEQQRAEERDALRAERHHDVLCRALEKLMDSYSRVDMCENIMVRETIVNAAHGFADLAYPPPKAEGT